MTDQNHSLPSPDPDKPFSEMAERIVHNGAVAGFGGAIVIVPPANGGATISTLLVDDASDPVQFWASLKAKCEIQLAELAANQRTQNAFQSRR